MKQPANQSRLFDPQRDQCLYSATANSPTITLDTGASYIYHEAGERYIPVKFSVRDRDLGGAVAEAQQRIAKNVELPQPATASSGPASSKTCRTHRARLEVIVPISLLLDSSVLLYGLFNSLRDSLMALAGIPFAAGGGVLALYFSGLNFSISAAIGFVSLFGVSVMNGILIMTYYNEVKATGMGTTDAMFHAASQRMRPMLMTALSACIGLLPAAISTGIGSQVQRPLATVVVGGMFIGPIMLLLVLPALQTLFLDWGQGSQEFPEFGSAPPGRCMTWSSTAMGRSISLLARLVATHALLFGAAMINTGLAEGIHSGSEPNRCQSA